jgi:hypothetical protein
VSDRFELDPLLLPHVVSQTGTVVVELDQVLAQTRRIEQTLLSLGDPGGALGPLRGALGNVTTVREQVASLQSDVDQRARLLGTLEFGWPGWFGQTPIEGNPFTVPFPVSPWPLPWPGWLPEPEPVPGPVLPPIDVFPPPPRPIPQPPRPLPPLFPPLWPEPVPIGPLPAQPGEQADPPTKAECSTALKILRGFERLCQKLGIKLSPKRLAELRKKLAEGTLRIDDLPAGLRRLFPARFYGKTIAEIEAECRGAV